MPNRTLSSVTEPARITSLQNGLNSPKNIQRAKIVQPKHTQLITHPTESSARNSDQNDVLRSLEHNKARIALQRLRRVRVGNSNNVSSSNFYDTEEANFGTASDDTTSYTSSKHKLSSVHEKRRNSLHPKINNTIPSQYSYLEKTYTKSELQEYYQLFKMFDTDNSGAIGNEELREAIHSIGLQASKVEIDELIKDVDEDGNGEIDYEEFCRCMKKSQKRVKTTNEEIIKQCFEVFDQDGNGIITENEFTYVAKEIGGFSQHLAEVVFSELDISSIGHLTAAQFGAIVEDYLFSDNSQSV